jgi:hypothetical protein
MSRLWIMLGYLLTTAASAADTTVWQDKGEIRQTVTAQARSLATSPVSSLQQYRVFGLDESLLKEQLAQTGNSLAAARTSTQTLQLPLPDGSFAEVAATPTEIFSPDVAAANPDIHTWKVIGTDGKTLTGVLDFTPLGFHAMLDMANGDTLFIEPQSTGENRQYASFSKRTNTAAFQKEGFSCPTHGKISSFSSTLPYTASSRTAAKAGETLNTFDIAIAATAEYTAYFGGKPSNALSAIVTTLNRVNQIYERDLSIHLRLVSGTNVIYTDAATDPYSNSDSSALLAENAKNLDAVIGNSNYDIGHVFSTASGGLAVVEGVCDPTYKAQGTTGISAPTGEIFSIDYVAHEIGHQLGATHTFNSTLNNCGGGNREAATAYEPGSGSSIMAYAGICGSDNLQSNSDAMFHAASIAQIKAYSHNGAGAACASSSSLSNANPTAMAGSDYTIPAATPFILSGAGLDTNGDALSYSWEQLDTGLASPVNVDMGNNALIRTHLPTASAIRTIPEMSDLTSGTTSPGEVVPVTNRVLNFRLQVRDGKGGTGQDDMQVTVQNTGSAFAITYPTTITFVPGSPQQVNWTVAGTDQQPINCSAVDIAITSDQGNTFTNLLAGTPNTGSASVMLPLTLGSSNYLRVKCSNNIFFALSRTIPAKASTSGSASASTSTSSGVATSSGSGGGGSMPLEWLVVGGIYAIFRLRKGTTS